jgi:hypothetical protein
MLAAMLFVGLIVLYAGGCLLWDRLGLGSRDISSNLESGDDFELLSRLDISTDGKLDGHL